MCVGKKRFAFKLSVCNWKKWVCKNRHRCIVCVLLWRFILNREIFKADWFQSMYFKWMKLKYCFDLTVKNWHFFKTSTVSPVNIHRVHVGVIYSVIDGIERKAYFSLRVFTFYKQIYHRNTISDILLYVKHQLMISHSLEAFSKNHHIDIIPTHIWY